MSRISNDMLTVIPQLLKRAKPLVLDRLKNQPTDCAYPLVRHVDVANIRVEVGKQSKRVDMHLYYLVVPLKDQGFENDRKTTIAGALIDVAKAMDSFCYDSNYEAYFLDPGFIVGKDAYLIGDGDDSRAVRFSGGAFYIWLRTWGPPYEEPLPEWMQPAQH